MHIVPHTSLYAQTRKLFRYWILEEWGVLLAARAVNVKVTVIEMRIVVVVFDVSYGIRPRN